jgi:hypothetical protein
MAPRTVLFLVSALALAACPGPKPAPPGECDAGAQRLDGGECVAPSPCPEGFSADPLGPGCVPIAATSCDAGTMPMLGHDSCVPVGWTSCVAGFAPAPSGWGCVPVAPASSCDAGTIAKLGSPECVPLGDCQAAFPPAGATLFVDPSGPVDATHFTSLAAALSAASSNAIIAVERGTYALTADVSVKKTVRVVGRCAAEVTVTSAPIRKAGLLVGSGGTLSLSGVTLSNLYYAVMVQPGGKAVIEDVHVRDSLGLGLGVVDTGELTIRRSRVTDTVQDTDGTEGFGLATEGAKLVVEDSVVERTQGYGVSVQRPGADATLERVQVLDGWSATDGTEAGLVVLGGGHAQAHASAFGRNAGGNISVADSTATFDQVAAFEPPAAADATLPSYDLVVLSNSTVTVTNSGLWGAHRVDVRVDGPATSLALASTTLRDTAVGADAALSVHDAEVTLDHTAVVAGDQLGLFLDGSRATVRTSLVSDTKPAASGYGVGIEVLPGALLVAEDSALVRNTTVGLLLSGGDVVAPAVPVASVTRTLVLDTRANAQGKAGHGVNVNNGGKLTLFSSVVSGSHEAGLSVVDSSADVADSVVTQTAGHADGAFGYGLMVLQGALGFTSTVHASRVTLSGNAGVGCFVAGATVGVQRSTFSRNTVAVHAQAGASLVQVEALPEPLTPSTLAITNDTSFFQNTQNVGAGVLPVPASIGPSP